MYIMNKKQEAYLSMVHKVLGEMGNYASVWSSNTVISNTVSNIEQLIVDIESINLRQNRTTIGLTKQKNDCRKLIDETCYIFNGIFRSYAKTVTDEDVYANSDMSLSEIKRIKDTEIMVLVNGTIDFANANSGDLVDYGLTAGMISDLEDLLAEYKEALTRPQEIIAERKTATNKLVVVFDEVSEQLNGHLDNHMIQFKVSEAQFYQDYINARNIYDNPTIKRVNGVGDGGVDGNVYDVVLGQVFDKISDEPIEGVLVRLEGTDIVTDSEVDGEFYIDEIPSGVYTVSFTKTGYERLEQHNVEVGTDVMVDLRVEMMPSDSKTAS
jgi:CarboxypepD_reg-like domain